LLEALARVRHDAVLSRAARGTSRRRAVLALALLWRVLPARARGWAVAALAAMMAGIIVNALTLQRARHPSPFFTVSPPMAPVAAKNSPEPASRPPFTPVAAKNSPEPASSLSEPPPTALPAPPPRPAGLGAANESVPLPRTADPIADIIRAGGNKDSQRLIATAQNALVKLGYPIKTGGAPGADTAAALRDFERARGLPISTEVTPRLVKLLNAAATSSASR
jgi:Putative peptidoglycan binding domain